MSRTRCNSSLRTLVCALVMFAALLAPAGAKAEREVSIYKLRVDLRAQPASFEITLIYRDDPRRESELQQGFKFVGNAATQDLSAQTPSGKPVGVALDRSMHELRVVYDLPGLEKGKSKVIVSFRQQIDVAQEAKPGRYRTSIPWAHMWKIPVANMTAELIFPPDVRPITNYGWECTPSEDRLTCIRDGGSPKPVELRHKGVGADSVLVWVPIATLAMLLGLMLLGWRWALSAKGVLPGADTDTEDWQAPVDWSTTVKLRDADRSDLIIRLAWTAALVLSFVGLGVLFAGPKLLWLGDPLEGSLELQMILVLAGVGLTAVLGLRPQTARGIGLVMFGAAATILILTVVFDVVALAGGALLGLMGVSSYFDDGSSSGGSYSRSSYSSGGGGGGGGCGGCGG